MLYTFIPNLFSYHYVIINRVGMIERGFEEAQEMVRLWVLVTAFCILFEQSENKLFNRRESLI